MTTPPPPGKGPAGKNRKRNLLIGGAVVAGVAGFALLKSRGSGTAGAGSSSAGTSGGTGYQDTGTATPYSYGGDFASAPDYTAQLEGINEQLATLVADSNPPGAPPPGLVIPGVPGVLARHPQGTPNPGPPAVKPKRGPKPGRRRTVPPAKPPARRRKR